MVTGMTSLREAVEQGEQGSFLSGMDVDDQEEVRAVLRALPADVDSAFMESLRSALASGSPIAFDWREHDGFDHSTETDAEGRTVLVLRTPNGRNFYTRPNP
jgi:hypothetical protein